jgi:hypothetical protein
MRCKINHFRKTVTTAGTREQMTTSNLRVPSVVIQAESDNTGRVYIGNSTVSSTNCFAHLGAGGSVSISAADFGLADAQIDLSQIWFDVGTSGDGAFCGYAERLENE